MKAAALRLEPLAVVLHRLQINRSQFYLDVKNGLWPPPVMPRARSPMWPSCETDKLLAAIISGVTAEKQRALVKQILKERLALMPPPAIREEPTRATA